MFTGTVKNAVKLQMLENKWQEKKTNINDNKKPQSEMTQDERMLASFQEQAEKERESNKHADTYNKLKSGGKLTSEEISYLEEHDPEALRKYREDQAEKAAYERELKNCKTKEDVDRVKMNKLGNFATQAKKITNDPYIPLDKKLELMNQLNNKLCLVNEAHEEFVKSKQYQDMPTEGELQEERTEEALERQEEMQSMGMFETTEEPEVVEELQESVEKQEQSNVGDLQEEKPEDTDKLEESAEEKMKKAAAEKEQKPKENEKKDENTLTFGGLSAEIRSFTALSGGGYGKVDIRL